MGTDIESENTSTDPIIADESEQKTIPEAQQQSTHPNEGPSITQIRQPLPGPDQSLPANAVPDTQSEQVQVKTEIGDVPTPDPQVPSNGTGPEGDAKAVSNLSIPAALY